MMAPFNSAQHKILHKKSCFYLRGTKTLSFCPSSSLQLLLQKSKNGRIKTKLLFNFFKCIMLWSLTFILYHRSSFRSFFIHFYGCLTLTKCRVSFWSNSNISAGVWKSYDLNFYVHPIWHLHRKIYWDKMLNLHSKIIFQLIQSFWIN